MTYQYNNHTLTSEDIMTIYGEPKLKLKLARKVKYGYELKYTNEYDGNGSGFLNFTRINIYLNQAK